VDEVMAILWTGIDQGRPVSWALSICLTLAGMLIASIGYRFVVAGPTVKTMLGTATVHGKSRQGQIARGFLVLAMGGGGFVLGLTLLSDLVCGWP
jgi:hypothetical protein